MESGHSTLFVIYCLVSNRVELFSGSRIWISRVILKYLYPLLIMLFASAAVRDKEVFSQSRIRCSVGSFRLYRCFFYTICRSSFSRSILVWYSKCDTLYYDVCVFFGSLLLYPMKGERIFYYACCLCFLVSYGYFVPVLWALHWLW